jgi:transcriptional regulator with XRE-family HTH domain
MHGRLRLRAWIQNHTNQRQFAAEIGVDESYVSQILSGRRTPRLPILGAIERETGIPMNSWLPMSNSKSSRTRTAKRKTRNIGGEKSRVSVG